MDATHDPHGLERFLEAQEGVIEQAMDELARGAKTGCWMWFVFPQLSGLGRSETARLYAIRSRDEARAYLEHPVLGPRLRRCVALAMSHPRLTAHDIFGSPDDIKLRSCLTLFAEVAAPEDDIFRRALDRLFAGRPDPRTLTLL
ncbi:DUF1810 domain-containing protein [Oceanicella actignis]|uniref:Uncharacterized protein, DUF1810 family n=1 Tax=Oceanicella actignis TaxID=1189325 RepID=A0A1M7SR34_9RHOB|nr:DUF1810 domain-containing protein [Oceanicella actignis]TYO90799.1 uncharacterized protein (DUF1810 family) [Oceanicella actignis]SES67220.1 Uncharacterized protein, DUF1810 family [Oceanicella actignis]SHN60884.1 Uncharacterized protein, DUF1810 family [Oceanicella actignis]